MIKLTECFFFHPLHLILCSSVSMTARMFECEECAKLHEIKNTFITHVENIICKDGIKIFCPNFISATKSEPKYFAKLNPVLVCSSRQICSTVINHGVN